MNKADKLKIAQDLEKVLTTFFTTTSYTTCCGKHWADRSKTPAQVAAESITVKRQVSNEKYRRLCDGKIVRLTYEVRSTQPSHVFAGFNLCRPNDQVTGHSIAQELLKFFNVKEFVNSDVNFFPSCLSFVVKRDGYFYHINLLPKMGHEL